MLGGGVRAWVLNFFLMALAGCATGPSTLGDACVMLQERDDWYEAAQASYERWGIPISVQLAIIYQESRFRPDAEPPREWLLGIIPWFRPSSAFGYGQITDSTWAWYTEETNNWWAERDDFDDVTDFIGWYAHRSHRRLGISKDDAYSHYLAYHEGHAGYRKSSYRGKPRILEAARRVRRQARIYRTQLQKCRSELGGGWFFW